MDTSFISYFLSLCLATILVVYLYQITNTNNYKNNSVNEPTFDIKNIQRYNPMNPIRKDSRRYAIDSIPETKPMVQNNREVKHFYPFEN